MKKIVLVIISIICLNNILFAQIDNDLIVVQQLFDDQKFDEVIKYKSKKIKQLSSKCLYYKGLSYFSTQDDKNANHFFDLAIKKGPTDEAMYFYRGFTFFYLGWFNNALIDFKYLIEQNQSKSIAYSLAGESFLRLNQKDSAIWYLNRAVKMQDCEPQTYITLASIYQEKEKFEEALELFKLALNFVKPKEELHQIASFNIGIIQQLTKKTEEAQMTFEKHLAIYPDDYEAISRLIQINTCNNENDKCKPLRDSLYLAYQNKLLQVPMQNMFCFDQFKWNEKQVLAMENFNENVDLIYICKYKFFILDKKGDIEFSIRSEKDTLSDTDKLDSAYVIKMIKDDSVFIYNNYTYKEDFSYEQLKLATIEILNEKIKPVAKIGRYNKLISQKRSMINHLSMPEKDGSSFKKAVIATSIHHEYEWLDKYFPGNRFIKQSLIFENEVPFDVLEIKTLDGETITVYFDISKFFGKGF